MLDFMGEKLLTAKEAAEILKVRKNTVGSKAFTKAGSKNYKKLKVKVPKKKLKLYKKILRKKGLSKKAKMR